MERHGTKPLPSLALMERDLEIYPLSARAYRSLLKENNSRRRQTNQPTPILKNPQPVRIVSASQLF
jgi:hypothetical protein